MTDNEPKVHEQFCGVLVLPATHKTESFELYAEWDMMSVLSMQGMCEPSNASFDQMVRMLLAGTANPEVYMTRDESELKTKPDLSFVIHDDITVWTMNQCLDTSPTPASLRLCPNHAVVLTGPTLVCGANPGQFFDNGSFRSLFRTLYSLEIEHIEQHMISWDSHDGMHLVPFNMTGYSGPREAFEKHFLQSPTGDRSWVGSDLNSILKGKKDD